MTTRLCLAAAAAFLGGWAVALPAMAAPAPADCPISHDQLAAALKANVKASGGPTNGGLDNNEWGAIVDRGGRTCAVAFSGEKVGDQWPGSRAIAVEKAETANNLSLKTMALSTANLYAGSQPGGMLYGLITTAPPSPTLLGAGDPSRYGTTEDPLIGSILGGVVVFGGGLALYDQNGNIVGGLGVSGDTSCADHNVAWRVRVQLHLNKVPKGVGPSNTDGIVYDIKNGKSASGYGHPTCGGKEADIAQEIGAGAKPH